MSAPRWLVDAGEEIVAVADEAFARQLARLIPGATVRRDPPEHWWIVNCKNHLRAFTTDDEATRFAASLLYPAPVEVVPAARLAEVERERERDMRRVAALRIGLVLSSEESRARVLRADDEAAKSTAPPPLSPAVERLCEAARDVREWYESTHHRVAAGPALKGLDAAMAAVREEAGQ